MKKYLGLFLLFLTLLLPSGCWSSWELKESAFLTGVALEKEGDLVKATYQVLRPKGGKDATDYAGEYMEVAGHTAGEVIARLTSKLHRRLFVTHNRLIIIGKGLAEEDILPPLDIVFRSSEFRLKSYLFYADNPVEVLKSRSPMENLSAIGLVKGVEAIERFETEMTPMAMEEYMEMISGPSQCSYMPVLLRSHEGVAEIDGTAVFKRGKLLKTLDIEETRGILWFRGKISGGAIHFPIPDDPEHYVSVDYHGSKTKIKIRMESGQPVADVMVEAGGHVGEWRSDLELTPERLREVEREFAAFVEKEMQRTLTRLREDPVGDVLNISLEVFRQQPDYWKAMGGDWEKIFRDIPVVIHVKATVGHTGMTQDIAGKIREKPQKSLLPRLHR